jgi:hypothetical protein
MQIFNNAGYCVHLPPIIVGRPCRLPSFCSAMGGSRHATPSFLSNPAGYAAAYVRRGAHLFMIRKLKSGSYRLYSRKKNPKTGKRRNLGTFKTRAAAKKHERAVQYFKRR